jgi:MarR family transcriptional regulator, organic hydroperoxide resistance regulator
MSQVAGDLPTPATPRLRRMLRANLQLLALADLLRDHWNLVARQHGLSGAQVKVLLGLSADEDTTMRALADRLSYDASNLTGVVDRLERDGHVERRSRESDRRVTELRLTAAGRRVRDEFWTVLNMHGPLDGLSMDRLSELDGALTAALARRKPRAGASAGARVPSTSASLEPRTSRRS